jgi:single-stranded-DNA-specific exonuclease
LNSYRWNVLPQGSSESLTSVFGLTPLIVQLLYNRGITEPAQIKLFLAADERLSVDPYSLPDIHQAVNRIYKALLAGERIAVYGDFDTDGITGAVLLVHGLSALGANVIPYIPHRLNEGHGLNHTALESLRQQGVSLVVTVDCGVTGISQVKRAMKKGLDVIITDHHTPLDELPPAVAVTDPKRSDTDGSSSGMAGVGVAFKLLQALYRGMGREEELATMLDLVALGTVADMVPLVGENRYLVKRGLEIINSAPRPGVKEMAIQAGLDIGGIDAVDISWTLAPRLNAAGRLEHAMDSYRLLDTDLPEEAIQLAAVLGEQNAERQRLTVKSLAKAREQVLVKGDSMLLMTCDRDYQGGILGLVAGRLAGEFYRPSVVVRVGDRFSSGSCRSIPEFDIIQAIGQCCHLLDQYGGHSQAAGFSLPTNNLGQLECQLVKIAQEQLADVDLRPRLDIDAEVILSQLAGDTFQAIQKLAPFGKGNPLPTFVSRNVAVVNCHTMGGNGNHLRLKLKQDSTHWGAVAFGLGARLPQVKSAIDIVYNLELDKWSGQAGLRLNILDIAPEVIS